MEPVIIYLPWPARTIHEAVTEFNEQMHDGAGVAEIQAGLHGLDFLTRRSYISDDLQVRLDGCIVEANMRIELLAAYDAAQRTEEENLARATTAVRAIKGQVEHILDLARMGFGSDGVYDLDPSNDEDD